MDINPENLNLIDKFSNTLDIFDEYIQNGVPGDTHESKIKDELNHFFTDSECYAVRISNNTDKTFFGIKVLPFNYDFDQLLNYDADPERIKQYIVDIDSKLFNRDTREAYTSYNHQFNINYGVDEAGIFALMFNEVANLINNNAPLLKARDAITEYITTTNKDLYRCEDRLHSLFNFAMSDTVNKFSSIFYTDIFTDLSVDKFTPNEFITQFGDVLMDPLEYIVDMIKKSNLYIEQNRKLVALQWFLEIYTDIDHRYFDIMETIDECIAFTGSIVERNSLEIIKKDLKGITKLHESGIISKIRFNGIKNIENELYEYAVRVKTVTTEDEARTLIREINSRMSILSDYIENECNGDNGEAEIWRKIYDKYAGLRDKLIAMPVAKYKYLQLWVNAVPES